MKMLENGEIDIMGGMLYNEPMQKYIIMQEIVME